MKIIYRAANIIEAHIVAGMLTASDIEAYVGGHYLQGAVGDLPPAGFATVSVADDDLDAAMTIIAEYDQGAEAKVDRRADDGGPIGMVDF
jgi:hypothetical protein